MKRREPKIEPEEPPLSLISYLTCINFLSISTKYNLSFKYDLKQLLATF